jgi:hypothetical protein
VIGSFTYGPWQASNLRSNLKGDLFANPNNSLTNVSVIKKIWDFNPGVGGPIVKDKLWFYFTFRHWGVNKTVADSYFNALGPTSLAYQPDLTRPGIDDGHIVSRAGRLSWQIGTKDKLTWYIDDQAKYRNHWGISALISPEASAIQVTPTSYVQTFKWTRTQSNKLLFDAGFGIYDQEYTELYQPDVIGSSAKTYNDSLIQKSTVYSITELTTGKVTGAWNNPADHFSILRTYSGGASYVTGAHSFHFGAALSEGSRRLVQRYTGDLTMTFSQGAPFSVTLRTPLDEKDGITGDFSTYAQDKWRIKRATLNLGIRYDWFRGNVMSEDLPASRWNPAAHFNAAPVQNWKDISPRVGIAYDLFGNGKTAIRASIARYVNGEEVGTVIAANPETTIGTTDTRTWTDCNHDKTIFNLDGSVQTCTLPNGSVVSELGPTTNTNFGKVIPSNTTTDPSVLNGWGARPYNWEFQGSVQHQLVRDLSLNVSYYRRSFGNQVIQDNVPLGKNAYDGPFCITAPTNPNLPNGGGYQVCGLYDLKTTFVGQVQNVRRLASAAGGITDVYQGYDVNVTSRFAKGTFIQGGILSQTRHYNTCNAPLLGANLQVNSPEARFCDQTFPLRPDMKLSGSHKLPWDFNISATYQFSMLTSPNILATWSAPNSVIQPALGRNLSVGTTKTISLIEPGKVWGDNLNQLDLRFSKRFNLEKTHLRVDADLYNAINSNWPFSLNNTFSTAATSNWLRPTNVLQGRLFKLGGQFDF